MASRRTTTVAPARAETAPPPPRHEEPRRRARRLERFAPYVFIAPLLAVFAAFYLWPAFVTVCRRFFRCDEADERRVVMPRDGQRRTRSFQTGVKLKVIEPRYLLVVC